jgi:hypothetical protein
MMMANSSPPIRATTSSSRAASQALSDKFEQLIADMVAERIVNTLKLIKVEAQHRETLATLDALDLVVELLQQEHAIGQLGQRVMARHMRDSVFGTLTLCHVFMGGEPATARNRLVDDRNSPPIGQI